jgi:hypothetical protein
LVTPLQFGEGPGVRLKNGRLSPFAKLKPFLVTGGFPLGLDEKGKPIFKDKP